MSGENDNTYPGNIEDLDEYTAFHPGPQEDLWKTFLDTGRFPKQRPRDGSYLCHDKHGQQYYRKPEVRIVTLADRSKRICAVAVDIGQSSVVFATEMLRHYYESVSVRVARFQTDRRRRTMCRRAETNDIALRSSNARILEVTERNRVDSSLLRLPAEIRAHIFEYVYSQPVVINISDIFVDNSYHLEAKHQHPDHDPHTTCCCRTGEGSAYFVRKVTLALPLTCRQIYIETISHLYSSNIFRFKDCRLMLSLPETIPTKHLRHITSLCLLFAADSIAAALRIHEVLDSTSKGRGNQKTRARAAKYHQQYCNFWTFLATNLMELRSLIVTFHQPLCNDPNLEQQICEWLFLPLCQSTGYSAEGSWRLGDTTRWTSKMTNFEVRLGAWWSYHRNPTDSSFIASFRERQPPFSLRRNCDCKCDWRRCIHSV